MGVKSNSNCITPRELRGWTVWTKNNAWAGLAYVTGLVNHELLLQNEYLAAENRIRSFPEQLRSILHIAAAILPSAVNRRVVGSSPVWGATRFHIEVGARLVNGAIAHFWGNWPE